MTTYRIDSLDGDYDLVSWIGEEVTLKPRGGGPDRVLNGSFVYSIDVNETRCNSDEV